MSEELIDSSYEPFTREAEYVEVNRAFVKSLPLPSFDLILDLACGTGTLIDLLLQEYQLVCQKGRRESGATILGIDRSPEQLQIARERFRELQASDSEDKPSVNLVQAPAECLPLADLSLMTVIMGNAIQLCEDKERVVREVNRVLRLGGLFAFNTSFYAGTYVAGTERFYGRWVEEALNYVCKRNVELRNQGAKGILRKRGLAKPAFSQSWLTRAEYEQLLCRNGFDVLVVNERTVLLTQSNFESIGSYAGLAGVLLSGYPLQIACEALQKSVKPALAAVHMEVVPRLWIEFIATKNAALPPSA